MSGHTIAIQCCDSICSAISFTTLLLALRKVISFNDRSNISSSSSSSSWLELLRPPKITESNMIDMLLGVLFTILLILSVFQGIGLLAIDHYHMCSFQGFMILWLELADLIWMCVLCGIFFVWIVRKRDKNKIRKHFYHFVIATFVISFIISSVVLGDDAYGPTKGDY